MTKEQERDFRVEELFFSTTDLNGKITSGNEVFARISGYSMEDLIGRPHSIIRHQDMPRVVFRLLWDRIQAGQPIAAYVKNKAKDGSYYWVLAFVSVVPKGYSSVRFKPTVGILDTVEELYQALRKTEIEIESQEKGTKDQAIQASGQLLQKSLQQLGYQDYDEFIEAALFAEFCSRNTQMKSNVTSASQQNESQMDHALQTLTNQFSLIFDHHSDFATLESSVADVSRFVNLMSVSIRRASLNMTIRSEQGAAQSGPLSVISNWLLVGSIKLSDQLEEIVAPIKEELSRVRRGLFRLACSQLQIDMISNFLLEARTLSEEKRGYSDRDAADMMMLLGANAQRTFQDSQKYLDGLGTAINRVNFSFASLQREVLSLGLAQVNGRVECARMDDGAALEVILQEVMQGISDAKDQLTSLAGNFSSMETLLNEFSSSTYKLSGIHEDLNKLCSSGVK